MNVSSYIIALCLLIILAISACAVIERPEGGPKDEDPPLVVTGGETTPNRQTFFSDRKVVLEFNEWVKVNNPVKEIFISPPLNYPLQISDKGKKVIMEFHEDEELKENTTYQINMGKSIRDLTEGNTLENYTFLFSTGAKLDKCSISGTVVNEIGGKERSDILVMLYDNLSDTVLTTLRPSYITRTDKEGKFSLNNIRKDSFQIFALNDQNVSYTYDQKNEEVAYLDSLIILATDVDSIPNLVLEIFDEQDEPLFIEARETQRGLITLVYTPFPENLIVNIIGDSLDAYTEIGKDTIFHWHQQFEADSLLLELSYDDVLDTVKVRRGKKNISKRPLTVLTDNLEILPRDTVILEWNKPLASDSAYENAISVEDSNQVYEVIDLSVDKKMMRILIDSLSTDSEYTMKIDSGMVKDWYGQYFQDSAEVSLKVLDPSILGAIHLDILKTDSLSYVMEVMDNRKVIDKRSIISSEKITLSNILPGNYTVNILQDLDGSGKWTGSSLSQKRRSEKKVEINLEPLKSGWELEATINITEEFDATQSN